MHLKFHSKQRNCLFVTFTNISWKMLYKNVIFRQFITTKTHTIQIAIARPPRSVFFHKHKKENEKIPHTHNTHIGWMLIETFIYAREREDGERWDRARSENSSRSWEICDNEESRRKPEKKKWNFKFQNLPILHNAAQLYRPRHWSGIK